MEQTTDEGLEDYWQKLHRNRWAIVSKCTPTEWTNKADVSDKVASPTEFMSIIDEDWSVYMLALLINLMKITMYMHATSNQIQNDVYVYSIT